ncbi:MAG: hypothetical protein B1H11_04515 [Desulfobacteraceae bacterium 4484_190.1]|nr:MAG: hypothetical protein B1H11_04515 [Desulfobacteraceae bacterium 4484_190.1]
MEEQLQKSLVQVARFYDNRKVGDAGFLGFRRSTDLSILLSCLGPLLDEKIIVPNESLFLDLGCADGRVNVFLSYLAKFSIGIELDEWTLDEYMQLRSELDKALKEDGLLTPPENIFLFHGDSMDEDVHRAVTSKTGISFEQFDLFYTYLIMHEEFAGLIVEKAKKGAIFLIYGLQKILPRYHGLRLLEHISPMEGILAFYRKE